MKNPRALFSAREASAELAISQATLYAYVSRGLIRSEPSGFPQPSLPGQGRPHAEGRRTPSPEPRGLRSLTPICR